MTQAPPPPAAPAAPSNLPPHRGTKILVFGILGFVCCFIFGILAWVMGSGDIKKMDAGQMDPSGRGITNAGKILGIIGTILNIIGLLFGLLGGAFGAAAA